MPSPAVRLRSITFTAESNAVDYLKHGCNFSKQALARPTSWKWAVIALHGAVYSFSICAAYGTNYESVLKNPSSKEPQLIDFWTALRASGVPLTSAEERSLQRLVKMLRNAFEHFSPKTWLIETYGMPRIAADALNIVERLAALGQTERRLGHQQMRSLNFLIRRTRRRLLSSRLNSEAEKLSRSATPSAFQRDA